MECREVLARYSEFLDGVLGGEKREEITRHLEGCDRCRSYQKILSDGLLAFRELPKPRLTDDFYLRLQHRLFHIKETSRKKERKALLVRWTMPTLSASFVFVLSLLFVSPYLPPSKDMDQAGGGRSGDTAKARESAVSRVGRFTNANPYPKRSDDSHRRDFYKKFVRNNMWRVFVKPPTGVLVGGGSMTRLGGTDLGGAVPVKVSITSLDGHSGLSSIGNTHYVGLGVSVIPVEFQVGDGHIREIKKGLRVLKVKEMTPAQVAGILPGDTIVAIDHLPVEGAEELSQLVISFSNQSKSIQIYRLGRLIELYVDL